MRRPALGAIAVIVTTILGCVTPGEILVGFDQSETVYISPANNDGIQDLVSYQLSVDVTDGRRLQRYTTTVIDSDRNAVRTTQVEVPADGLRGGRSGGQDSPDIVLWDGRDDAGELAPDGEYEISVQVWDDRDNTATGANQRVIVDNTAGEVDLSSLTLLFTPDGDDRQEELAILQRNSSVEDRWTGTVTDQDGETVRSFEWSGAASDLVWDGTTNDGDPAPEGIYTYSVGTTDRAGNTSLFQLRGIELERDPRQVSLFVSKTAFSPNADGQLDTLTLHASLPILKNLDEWEIEVRSADGLLARTFTGTGDPDDVIFDGLGDGGEPVADGRYRARLTATYAGGQQPTAYSPLFTIDTDPPRAQVEVSSLVFSPDGDGSRDTVEIFQSSSTEQMWTGTFRDPIGSVVRSVTWSGEVSNIVWDGTSHSGERLTDGAYTYELSATDLAGNPSASSITTIRIDTRPVSIRILRTDSIISPNGDGVRDTVTLNVISDVSEGIDRWVLSLNDASGRGVGELTSGTSMFPQRFLWDGRLDGELVADGIYYPQLEVANENGSVSRALGSSVRVDTTGPEITLEFRPDYFSPDGDGTGDVLTISILAADPSSMVSWEAAIRDPNGRLFAEWSGTGRPPPAITWDGLSPSGELVQAGEDYHVAVTAVDTVANTGSGETLVPIDILVTREGNRLRLSSIYFEPNTFEYENLDNSGRAQENLQTVDRLARVLERYPQYSIRIEGHATHLLSFDPLMAQTEHLQVLVPLSFARAEAIREALVNRGIPRDRMSVFGYGGIKPVVPHNDELNRWQNRRVEFFLERR